MTGTFCYLSSTSLSLFGITSTSYNLLIVVLELRVKMNLNQPCKSEILVTKTFIFGNLPMSTFVVIFKVHLWVLL